MTTTKTTTITNTATLSEIFHCSQVLIPFSYSNSEGETVNDNLVIATNLDQSDGIFGTFNLTFSYSKSKLYELSFNKMSVTGKPTNKKVLPFKMTQLIDDSLSGYEINNNDNADQRIILLIYILRTCIEKDTAKSNDIGLLIFKPISKVIFKEQINLLATNLESKNIMFQSHFKILKSFIDSKVVG